MELARKRLHKIQFMGEISMKKDYNEYKKELGDLIL